MIYKVCSKGNRSLRFNAFGPSKGKKPIVDSNHEELNETSREKENLFLKIRILEEKRLPVLEKLARNLGQPAQDLTLSKLSQLVQEP